MEHVSANPGHPGSGVRGEAVRLEGLGKRFGGKWAVQGLSAAIPVGAVCGIIGPNGSGKTTTLRMILDIIEPDEGSIRVMGTDKPGLANRRISYLPEERGLYRKMSVRHQLSYFARLKEIPEREILPRIRGWLERLELPDVLDRKVETLSKGMAQKVQLVAAVMNDPELLVLDEPFSGLDPVNLEVVRKAVLDLRSRGTTLLFSTHDMAMAEKLCDNILMIYRGKKVLDGTLQQIQEKFGRDTVRVRFAAGSEGRGRELLSRRLGAAADESNLRVLGRSLEARGVTDPQGLLRALSAEVELDYFEISPPNLHEIFIRIARPEAGEEPGEERETVR